MRDLGTFSTGRDMRGVFQPRTRDFLAVIAAFLAVLTIGLAVITEREQAQQFEVARRT